METKEYLTGEIIRLRIALVERKAEVMRVNNQLALANEKIIKMRGTINDKDEDINRVYSQFKKLEDAVY